MRGKVQKMKVRGTIDEIRKNYRRTLLKIDILTNLPLVPKEKKKQKKNRLNMCLELLLLFNPREQGTETVLRKLSKAISE